MEPVKTVSGNTESEIWSQITADLLQDVDILQYAVIMNQQGRQVYLDIDIDLGGGFESGYATTIFQAAFRNSAGFRFAIHREDFLDEIGKFFGMQDVQTGYPEFDDRVLVKANDEARVKALFSEPLSRQVFQQLKDYTFETEKVENENGEAGWQLRLFIEDGITDPEKLRLIYNAFYQVLLKLEAGAATPGTVNQ